MRAADDFRRHAMRMQQLVSFAHYARRGLDVARAASMRGSMMIQYDMRR